MGERARCVFAVGALLALAGCADQGKQDEAALTQLVGWLPGTYDTSEQAAEDARVGRQPAHARITLVIARTYAPRIGHHAQYVQEMDADDPNRVESQHLYIFKVDEKRGIEQTVYGFVEPLRWRDGQKDTLLFTSLAKDDLESVPGCELWWKKGPEVPKGQKPDKGSATFFTGAVDPAKCHPPSSVTPPAAMKLTENSLTIGDYQFRKIRN
jgi:CpeT/CpcT family (DUF1001)